MEISYKERSWAWISSKEERSKAEALVREIREVAGEDCFLLKVEVGSGYALMDLEDRYSSSVFSDSRVYLEEESKARCWSSEEGRSSLREVSWLEALIEDLEELLESIREDEEERKLRLEL